MQVVAACLKTAPIRVGLLWALADQPRLSPTHLRALAGQKN